MFAVQAAFDIRVGALVTVAIDDGDGHFGRAVQGLPCCHWPASPGMVSKAIEPPAKEQNSRTRRTFAWQRPRERAQIPLCPRGICVSLPVMKAPVLCLVIAAAGAVGLCGGWMLWGGKENAAEGVVSRAIASGRPGENGPRKADRKASLTAGPVGSHAAEVMASELDIINALTPQEFGIAMTDLWLAAPTPDNLIRRGLYLASCNGERGEQFYVEYKRRKGLSHGENSGLGEFFTGTGSQDGRDFLDRMLKIAPGGFCELECVTHGWALTDAQGAVDWLNALPEGAPYYQQALRGLMWGLAQVSPEQAMQVYTKLDPMERSPGGDRQHRQVHRGESRHQRSGGTPLLHPGREGAGELL